MAVQTREKALADQELVPALKNSDRRAFEVFFHRHFESVYRLVWELVRNEEAAHDLTQSAFLKIWEVRETLDPNRPADGFLRVVARNLAVSWLRRPNNRHHLSVEEYDVAQEDHQGDLDELSERLHAAIRELEEPLRVVLNLRLRGFKDKEIAEILGVSVATVDKRKTKAFRILRERLREYL